MGTYKQCFEQKYEKYRNFLSENFQIFGGKIFSIFDKTCFRNGLSVVGLSFSLILQVFSRTIFILLFQTLSVIPKYLLFERL